MSFTSNQYTLVLAGRFSVRKHSNKQKVCWIRPSNEVISNTEPPRAKGRPHVHQFDQSGESTTATREQAAASAARWRSDGAPITGDADTSVVSLGQSCSGC